MNFRKKISFKIFSRKDISKRNTLKNFPVKMSRKKLLKKNVQNKKFLLKN